MWLVSQEPTSLTGTKISSAVWGNVPTEVSQDFGVPGFRPDWYGYSQYHHFPAGYHIGLDVAVPKLTPIYSAVEGDVTQAGFSDSFRPNPVTVTTTDDPRTSDNESGFQIIHGHLWQDAVAVGQHVRPGDLIGYSGEQTEMGTMTPDGSGPHIHYEVYDPASDAINPLPFLGVNFTPKGTPLNFPIPGAGVVSDTAGAISDIAAKAKTLFERAGIAVVGLLFLMLGVYAVSQGGVGVAVKKGKSVGTKAAKMAVL